jgi:hypothetical protein
MLLPFTAFGPVVGGVVSEPLIQYCSAFVAVAATESEEAAEVLDDALLDASALDEVLADEAGALDDELLLLQPATTARLAVAARQAMRHRVSELRPPRAGVFIPPPFPGVAIVPPDGIVSVLRNLQARPACAQVLRK